MAIEVPKLGDKVIDTQGREGSASFNPNDGTPLYDSNKVSNPGGPSSSSTVNTNNSIDTGTKSGTDSANGTKPKLSSIQNSIIKTYGLDEDYVRGLSSDAIGQFAIQIKSDQVASDQAKQAKADQDSLYQNKLAEQNAEYAQAKADLDTQKNKDLDVAKTTSAALNPYGGPNTDEDNYTGTINNEYTKLQQTLDNQAKQAQAALAAGNMDAYAKINANIAKTKTDGLANIQTIIQGVTKNKQFDQEEADKAATLKQNDELKNTSLYQSALTNLPQPKQLADLGDDFSKLTTEQQAYIQGQQAYQVGIQAGLTPQGVWSGIKNAATSAYKQQAADAKQQEIAISNARAQAYLASAQANLLNKQSAALDIQTIAMPAGGAFLDALYNAQNNGKYTKDKNERAVSTLAYNLGKGDTENAKTSLVNFALSGGSATDQRMYNTLQGLPALVLSIQSKIDALPADQKQSFMKGTINELLNKVGQTKDPKLQEIGFELAHLQKNYVAPIYGMRAATAGDKDSVFNNLFSNVTDSKDLSLTKLNALVSTAQDTVNSQVQSRIGAQPYSVLFPNGALGSPTPISTSGMTVMTGPKGTFNIPASEVENAKKQGYIIK